MKILLAFGICLGGLPLLLSGAVSAADDSLDAALALARRGPSAEAVAMLTRLIEAQPKQAELRYHRGRENFRLGRVTESVADFDRYVELNPAAEKSQWERGIALYYAGQFDRGAKQFELYQTFHNADVENAAWRYLCVARSAGVEKAKESILPIEGDPRVPMMEIYDLFRGKLQPEDVLAAANAGKPTPGELDRRLFYANLYVGLWYEAQGEAAKARPHLQLAAEKHHLRHYMDDVARVHWERLKAK